MFFQQTSTKTKKTLQYSMTNTCNHKHIQTKYMNTSDKKKTVFIVSVTEQCVVGLQKANFNKLIS